MTKKGKQNKLTTQTINIQDLKPAPYNPRIMPPSEQLKLKNGLETFGLVDPIIIDLTDENTVIGGHQRLEVLREIDDEQDLTLIPLGDIGLVIREKELKIKDKNDQKALNLSLNKIQGDFDYNKVNNLLLELSEDYYQIELTGFGDEDLELEFDDLDDLLPDGNEFPSDEEVINQQEQPENNKEEDTPSRHGTMTELLYNTEQGGLVKRYTAPSFSVLDTMQGYWQDRKKQWEELIQDKGETREELIGDTYGVSVFDSCLADILTQWFTPETTNNKIIDPFSGDSIIGYVSSKKNNQFTGIELRKEQCKINNQRIQNFSKSKYINDDAQNVLDHIPKKSQDLLISCPPYYNLEVYSDLENDASNQETYEEFYKILDTAFTNAIQTLKENRFAAIVIGNIRDENGFYYNITGDIINTFQKNNMLLYNWLILKNSTGGAALRAKRNMKTRKMVKTHQDILIFYNGNPQEIPNHFPPEPAPPFKLGEEK